MVAEGAAGVGGVLLLFWIMMRYGIELNLVTCACRLLRTALLQVL
jgi:hypothetical protein